MGGRRGSLPNVSQSCDGGQALVELALVLPLMLAVVCGGLTLSRLAIVQTEVQLAATFGVAADDPRRAVRDYLARSRLSSPEAASVEVRRVAELLTVTVDYPLSLAWWPGETQRKVNLTATAARGRALLCNR